jgi:hypothetical protein
MPNHCLRKNCIHASGEPLIPNNQVTNLVIDLTLILNRREKNNSERKETAASGKQE